MCRATPFLPKGALVKVSFDLLDRLVRAGPFLAHRRNCCLRFGANSGKNLQVALFVQEKIPARTISKHLTQKKG
jgi:hypothetical protein